MLCLHTAQSMMTMTSRTLVPETQRDELTLCRAAAAAEAAQAFKRALVPGFIRRLLRDRADAAALDQAIRRLAETSPHLLRDIGITEGVEIEAGLPRGAAAGIEVVRPEPTAAPRRVVKVSRAPAPAQGLGATYA
jgi:uncharacterized protein YjiS (DUF1127 family)